MNMNKNVLEHMDKAAYIILLCIAAVAVLVSMVTEGRSAIKAFPSALP